MKRLMAGRIGVVGSNMTDLITYRDRDGGLYCGDVVRHAPSPRGDQADPGLARSSYRVRTPPWSRSWAWNRPTRLWISARPGARASTTATVNQTIAARDGQVVAIHMVQPGGTYPLEWLVQERSIILNTTAAGGDANLMMIG